MEHSPAVAVVEALGGGSGKSFLSGAQVAAPMMGQFCEGAPGVPGGLLQSLLLIVLPMIL